GRPARHQRKDPSRRDSFLPGCLEDPRVTREARKPAVKDREAPAPRLRETRGIRVEEVDRPSGVRRAPSRGQIRPPHLLCPRPRRAPAPAPPPPPRAAPGRRGPGRAAPRGPAPPGAGGAPPPPPPSPPRAGAKTRRSTGSKRNRAPPASPA